MARHHLPDNEAYADQLRRSVSTHPAVGPAALIVLERFAAHRGPDTYNPRSLVSVASDPQRPGARRVEDALAALTVLEVRTFLDPPTRAHSLGAWKTGDMDAVTRIAPFTTEAWTVLLERYWALLFAYLPAYHRTVSLNHRMLAQLIALGGGYAVDVTRAQSAFAQWIYRRGLRQHIAVDGALAFADPVKERGWRAGPDADAQWMRDHLCRQRPVIQVTTAGALLLRDELPPQALRLDAKAVAKALAYDAAHAYARGERLLAQRTSDGAGYVTLVALAEHVVGPSTVSALTAVVTRLSSADISARLQGIVNTAVREAAVDEAEHVSEILVELVRWCGHQAELATHDFTSTDAAAQRLLAAVQACRSTAAPPQSSRHNWGVHWTKGMAAVTALPGIRRDLTRADVSNVLPSGAWAYPNVQPRLHPLYGLLTPVGVRPSALILAAHRYHRDAVTRADARIALKESQCLQELVDASIRTHRGTDGRG